jgi:antitoxin VapB
MTHCNPWFTQSVLKILIDVFDEKSVLLEYILLYTHVFLIMQTTQTRVFMNGNSQAVRIPQEFRLDTDQVEIFRNRDGDLVLHAVPVKRGDALRAALSGFDKEFGEILEELQRDQLPVQERKAL